MYVIAVDTDGTIENQKRLNSTASFIFVRSVDQLQETLIFHERAIEISFQHYSYILPIVKEDSEGSYQLTLGYYYATCIAYKLPNKMNIHSILYSAKV